MNLPLSPLGPIGPQRPRLWVARAHGPWVYNARGRPFLDMVSGLLVNVLGHRHPVVERALRRQLARHTHVMVYGVWPQRIQWALARALTRQLPRGLDHFYPTCTGTEAIEAALKFACYATGRSHIVAFEGAYHGETQGSLAVMGDARYRRAFLWVDAEVRFLPWNQIGPLDAIDTRVAAVILEPVQGEAGIRPAQRSFLRAVVQRAREAGALVVFDEVQTGLGRVGAWWAADRYRVRPDLMVLGKALGGGLPLGGVAVSRDLAQRLSASGLVPHLTTFGGHPLACAAALATLQVLRRRRLPQRVRATERRIAARLEAWRREHPGRVHAVRGLGYMWGIQMDHAETAERFERRLARNGILVDRTLLDLRVVRIAPPLVLPLRLLDRALERMGKILAGL